jgi:hypothetical protein
MEALEPIGEPALPALTLNLDFSGNAHSRQNAATVLGYIGSPTQVYRISMASPKL